MTECFAAVLRPLDDAEKPENEDQEQQAAKTDIHLFPPVFRLDVKRKSAHCRSIRFDTVTYTLGIILPVRKVPVLLDFPALTRK